jgi:hypothetical protein
MDETVETTSGVLGDRRRRFAGRLGIVVLWVVGAILALGALAVVALAAFIAHGPVEVETAARTAETLLGEIAGPGGRATVGKARLDLSWDKGLSVGLDEIVVDRAGVVAMRIPHAKIGLRLTPILTGRVQPSSLVLFDPHVRVDAAGLAAAGAMVAASGETEPASGGSGASGSTVAMPMAPGEARSVALPPRPVRAIAEAQEIGRAVDRALAQARQDGIERFVVRNGTIDLVHPVHGDATRVVTLPEIEVEAVVDGPGGDLDVDFSARGEIGRWSMRLTAGRDTGGGRRLTFVAADVTLRDLFGPPGPAFDLGMPVYPRLVLHYGPEDRYDGAEIDVRLGAGEFRFGPMPEDSMLVDEGQIQVDWKAGTDSFDIRNLYVAVGETGMTLHGRVTPPAVRDGPWAIALAADRGSFRPRDVPGAPLIVDGGRLAARFDPVAKVVDITAAEATFGADRVTSAGRIDFSGEEPKLKLDLAFTPLDTDQVKRIWPHWVAPDTREWFIRQVDAGKIFDTMIRLDLPRFDKQETWPGTAFRMTMRFEDAKFRSFGNLPAVVGAVGRMNIDARRMDLVVDRAQMATKWPKRPSLEAIRFSVPDIFVKPPKGTLQFRVAGEVPALAEVIDSEPLAILGQAGIRADGLSGTATVDARIDILFEKQIRAASVDYKVEATLDRFASVHPIQGRKFQDGKFKIVADPRGLKVTGRAQIDGVVADVDMFDALGGSKAADRRDFKMVLDDAARQRIGLDLGDLVHGAIGVSVVQPSQSDARRKVEVDLTPAQLVLSAFGWSKGSGVPAKASLDLVEDDKGVRLDNLAVEAEGLTIAGSVQLDKEHRIVSADISKFALRKGDAAKIKVTRSADQTLTVGFDAQSFDLRGLLQASRKTGGEESRSGKPTDLLLKLRAARLVGFNDVTLFDVGVDGRYRAGAFANLQMSGRSSGGRALSASIRPDGGKRTLVVNAEDAGAVLSFLDFFDRVEGGRLTLNARLSGPGVAQGGVRLDDFHLLEDPKTGRATPQKTADGVQQVKVRRVEINPQTDFSRSSVRFSMRDGVITVTEGVAKGTSVGATMSGQLDLNNQRVSLSGTYIPAYGLNNLAGRIPLVGAITGAGTNEGLVGVTFRVFGPLEDPILEINPLSAIAPGIFRRIFEFQSGGQAAPKPASGAPTRITP